jgi:uncharacterized protein YceK
MILSSVAGCGTVINTCRPCSGGGSSLPEPYRVYGGVRADLELAAEPLKHCWEAKDVDLARRFAGSALICALCAVDLPLSLVGDTLTLPFTAMLDPSLRATPVDEAALQPRTVYTVERP